MSLSLDLLGDPTRRAMLALLRLEGEAWVQRMPSVKVTASVSTQPLSQRVQPGVVATGILIVGFVFNAVL